jgi:hypothetical protein
MAPSNPSPDAAGSVVRPKAAFAQRAQNVVMALLIVSLLMVAQGFSLQVTQWGVGLLVIMVFLQIAVSNVAPSAGPAKTIRKSVIIVLITLAIFAFSIWVTPYLVALGR